jgi:hypothetical protein
MFVYKLRVLKGYYLVNVTVSNIKTVIINLLLSNEIFFPNNKSFFNL